MILIYFLTKIGNKDWKSTSYSHILVLVSSLLLTSVHAQDVTITVDAAGNKKTVSSQATSSRNPVIFADVPDMSMVRVGDTYYMSSTTMHMNPGVPIMKSNDLVNWKLVCYAYDTLASMDELNLTNGKSTYGRGSWASCIRYQNGTYFVSTFAATTGKTYIFSTKNIENGPMENSFLQTCLS